MLCLFGCEERAISCKIKYLLAAAPLELDTVCELDPTMQATFGSFTTYYITAPEIIGENKKSTKV
jgi:hypothetical protein